MALFPKAIFFLLSLNKDGLLYLPSDWHVVLSKCSRTLYYKYSYGRWIVLFLHKTSIRYIQFLCVLVCSFFFFQCNQLIWTPLLFYISTPEAMKRQFFQVTPKAGMLFKHCISQNMWPATQNSCYWCCRGPVMMLLVLLGLFWYSP